MSITTINEGDYQDDSRTTINDNFSDLDTRKANKAGETFTGQINFSGTNHAGVKLISLTTAQRDALTPAVGMAIYNTTLGLVQVYQGTTWASVSPFDVGDLKWSTRAASTGWLLCDGSAVSRATYSDLFAVLSTTYGAGDGSTTFNLPKVNGRVLVGAGANTVVATFVSRASNVITVSGLSNTAENEFQTGQAVLYTAASGAMTGLVHNTTYYLIRTGNLTFSLASSLANAIAGTAIALSSDGTGAQTFTLSLTTKTLSHTGGEEKHGLTIAELPAHTHDPVSFLQGESGTDSQIGLGSGNSSPDDGNPPKVAAATYLNTTSAGSSTQHNNLQPFLVENLFIKY